ncbi:MAG: SDR family NAD(P)-dependent oxidoreductase [Acidimicrobiales bacterium]|nr:SDR family NAD(P)-dependent oxidoreductase [Acidimicrobiales bacterium]
MTATSGPDQAGHRLAGQTVVISGASRGIGADMARLFAAEGAYVLCAARTMHQGDHKLAGSLETTVGLIREAGGVAAAVAADLSRPEDREAIVAAAHKEFGPIDVLVNNALLVYRYPVHEYPLQRWMRSWEVNFQAPFHLSQLALADMIPRRSGRILNISSGAAAGPGRGPYPGAEELRLDMTCYGAEKAALERFTQGLAQEVYQYGIAVNALSPTQIVATDGVLLQGFARSHEEERLEPLELMSKASLLLVTEPLDAVTGRVAYSQQILHEFGWLDRAPHPRERVSGFSLI